jgi:cytochrome P450
MRKQVQPGFNKGAMDSWQAMTDKLAVELVSGMLARRECDVVQHLTIPMPIRMIAQILGFPECDVGDFRRWSEDAVRLMDFTPTCSGLAGAAKSMSAMAALRRYFLRQFSSGGLKGSGTVLGRLLEHNTDGSLTDQQLFLIAIHLLIAGNETTSNLLGGMFDTFAHHPEQYDLIRANPDLIPMAVEEQLRITTPIQNLYR